MHVENIIIVKSKDKLLINELTKELQTFYPHGSFTSTNTEIRYTGYIGKSASTNIKEINARTVHELYMHIFTHIYGNYTYSSHYQYLILIDKIIQTRPPRLKFLIHDPYGKDNRYVVQVDELDSLYRHYIGGNL